MQDTLQWELRVSTFRLRQAVDFVPCSVDALVDSTHSGLTPHFYPIDVRPFIIGCRLILLVLRFE